MYLLLGLLIPLSLITAAGILTGRKIAKKRPTGKESDYLIVLGCRVKGSKPSAMLQERICAAYEQLRQRDIICIVSGGKGNGGQLSEAQCMFNELTARGIDSERIWLEDQSVSTWENLEFSLALIEKRTGKRPDTVDVLSSDFHLCRVQLFARKMGIPINPNHANTTHSLRYYLIFLREILVIWYYSIFQ